MKLILCACRAVVRTAIRFFIWAGFRFEWIAMRLIPLQKYLTKRIEGA